MVEMARQDFGKDLGLVHEAVIMGRKVGAGHDFWAKLAHNEGLFRATVAFVNRGGGEVVFQLSESQKAAQSIMGKNFFGIAEAMLHFGIKPTAEQLATLAEIPYSSETLEECKCSHVLVAIFPISILEIREKAGGCFYSQSEYESEEFASQQGEAGWMLVRKTATPGSFSKNWARQQVLLGEDEEVPDARVLVYVVIGHFLATGGERLFSDKYVRTSSTLDSGGGRVSAGGFGSDGLYLYDAWGGARDGVLGLSSFLPRGRS